MTISHCTDKNQLASIGVVIPETYLMASILSSLSSSWEGLSDNLIYSTDLPFSEFSSLMIQEELHRELMEQPRPEQGAYTLGTRVRPQIRH